MLFRETVAVYCENHTEHINTLCGQKQKQKLTAGKQPARSILAPGPPGTHGHIFVHCQDLCFVLFSPSLILLIDKEGLVFYIYIEWCLLATPYAT
jgi:hypothetical protein